MIKKSFRAYITQNQQIVFNAGKDIQLAVNKLKQGVSIKDGLGFFYHIAGFLGQHFWFISKTYLSAV
ncbi:MAG: hypothetical protein HFH95_09860 [Lachnospiraceae bacterium]|nr:hypothetical protein [uncultured Acetatifactor sp.]MCI8543604.1 hypothetical protein [Lachnospiraceae bacterium]